MDVEELQNILKNYPLNMEVTISNRGDLDTDFFPIGAVRCNRLGETFIALEIEEK